MMWIVDKETIPVVQLPNSFDRRPTWPNLPIVIHCNESHPLVRIRVAGNVREGTCIQMASSGHRGDDYQ